MLDVTTQAPTLDTHSAPAPALDIGLTHVSRIYCGRGIPAARRVDLGSCTSRYTEITDKGVEKFIREVLAEQFPDGWTITHGVGGWRDLTTGETIHERNFVIEVAHSTLAASRVDAVAREWKRWAQQEAVMVTTHEVPTRFL